MSVHPPCAGSHNSSSSSGAVAKKRKPPGIDLATGRAIPDFNVNGVLDVLHELGSGGSGTTYLCRDLATSKVCLLGVCGRVCVCGGEWTAAAPPTCAGTWQHQCLGLAARGVVPSTVCVGWGCASMLVGAGV